MPDNRLDAIPMLDLKGEVEELWDDINAAIQRVLRSGQFILGAEVEAFEEEVAAFLGVKHAVGVNSGTDALVIGLRALGIGPGDEVIVPHFTFYATYEAVLQVGARPLFVDVDPESFNIEPELVERAVTSRTRAILPVHLFGRPAPMGEILDIAHRHGLTVLEDAAQAFGARYYGPAPSHVGTDSWEAPTEGRHLGSLGTAAAFSFYPTKNLAALGDAGLITTDDDEVAKSARRLRNHGQDVSGSYAHVGLGYNSRLDEIQAAVLRSRLAHVEGWNRQRVAAARRYVELLGPRADIVTPDITRGHVFHQFTLRLPDGARDRVKCELQQRGIATKIFYPPQLGATAADAYVRPQDLQRSTRLRHEVLSLPIWPGISIDAQLRIAAAVAEAT